MEAGAGADPANQGADLHQRLGLLTRQLHDSLNGLGLADQLKDSAGELPDAKTRLGYIARLTGEAAEKVLNRVDQAKARHEQLKARARAMAALASADPTGSLAAGSVLAFVQEVERTAHAVDQDLTEIMLAQDFHDLTGQVIARVVQLAATIETQLVQLLIQTAPAPAGARPAPAQAGKPVLAGPVFQAGAGADVVTAQSEVDELLASLGF